MTIVRPVRLQDAAAICAIYNHFVLHTVISFDDDPVSPHDMAQRIRELTASLPWYVCEVESKVVGYAYAAPWKTRSAYRFSVESSVYVAPGHEGQGIGRKLYRVLLPELRSRKVHSVVGGIALPNPASVGLHEAMGFRQIARFQEIGRKFERWIDVGYWQLLLND